MYGVGRGERAGRHGVFFVGAAEVGRVHVHGCGRAGGCSELLLGVGGRLAADGDSSFGSCFGEARVGEEGLAMRVETGKTQQ
jgi:hypothetical protein